jgi:hypothetical protein
MNSFSIPSPNASLNIDVMLLRMQADRLRQIADTDDLAMLRHAKEADASATFLNRFLRKRLPNMSAQGFDSKRNSRRALELISGDGRSRRDHMLALATSLDELCDAAARVRAASEGEYLDWVQAAQTVLDKVPQAARI